MKEFVLTPSEREAFQKTKGYLVIPGALDAGQLEQLSRAVDVVAKEHESGGHSSLNVADVLGRDDAFLDLIDCPRVLPKIWGLLGWNIWVQHSHVTLNVPPALAAPALAQPFEYHWHRDGGAINRDLGLSDAIPPLLLKVGFYLNDVELNGGATIMVDEPELGGPIPPTHELPPSVTPLLVKAGTAVIFSNRCIHSLRSPNTSPAVRKTVFIQYGYRWVQGLDRGSVAHLAERVSDVRKQLLGLTETFTEKNWNGSEGRSGLFYPSEQDVPLLRFIIDLLGDEAQQYVARSVAPSELRGY